MRRLLTLALLAGAPAAPAAPEIETGELNGAPFAVAVPGTWSGFMLLIAPGYRAAERPRTVELAADGPVVHRLLEEGWIVARTAYRRNGVILADAIADLDALRDYLAQRHGEPRRVVIEGEGMGGLAAVLVAEREPETSLGARPRYAGVVAVAPALNLRDPASNLGLSLQPRIPVVFLCPRSQLEAARQYATAHVPRPGNLRPLLCSVAREGSAAINQAERYGALVALADWLERGRPAWGSPGGIEAHDLTRAPEPHPSRVTAHPEGNAFTARVTATAVETGSLILDAQPADFAAAGIGARSWFQLETANGTWRVLLGRDFSQVRRGEWLAFPDGEGWMWIGRHGADAAATAELQVGDAVTVRRYAATAAEAARAGP